MPILPKGSADVDERNGQPWLPPMPSNLFPEQPRQAHPLPRSVWPLLLAGSSPSTPLCQCPPPPSLSGPLSQFTQGPGAPKHFNLPEGKKQQGRSPPV